MAPTPVARARVERLVLEETKAMVVRVVQRMLPRAPLATIERSADELVDELPPFARLTDAEIAAAPESDEGVRAEWRRIFEAQLGKMLAGEMPS